MKKESYCYYCNKDVIFKVKFKTNNYVVNSKQIKVKEKIYYCPFCNHELINDTLDDSLYLIYNEYLRLEGLSFEKIKKIRKYYNLSQELFGKALGISKRTIIRYENADILPNKKNIMIYQKIDNNKDEFVSYLKENKKNMDDETYYKIYNLINPNLDIKTINAFLYVLSNNYLSITQIMKNFFAIDFECYKKTNKPLTCLKYAHGNYGPIIDNKNMIITFLIKQNYIEMLNNEDDIIIFKSNNNADMSLFSKEEIEIMDEVIKKLKNKSSSSLTKWSHYFTGWKNTKNGDPIDYSYAKEFELNKNWN